MKFKDYLNEKTYQVGKDVDYIYKKYFRSTVNKIKKGKWDDDFGAFSMPSSDLPSKAAKNASKVNPVKIRISLDPRGNYYRVTDHIINLTMNVNALDMLKQYGTVGKAMEQVPSGLAKSFEQEFTESKIKASIYHEITHWLDDSFHGSFITKMHIRAIKKQNTLGSTKSQVVKILNRGNDTVGATEYEMNAQIHAIKQMKRVHKKVWDTLYFTEMLKMDGGLIAVWDSLSMRERNPWKKKMLTRMAREKLLGKLMKYKEKL